MGWDGELPIERIGMGAPVEGEVIGDLAVEELPICASAGAAIRSAAAVATDSCKVAFFMLSPGTHHVEMCGLLLAGGQSDRCQSYK
jgi:hypothetical protein